MECPHCKADNPDEHKCCKECGAPLHAPAPLHPEVINSIQTLVRNEISRQFQEETEKKAKIEEFADSKATQAIISSLSQLAGIARAVGFFIGIPVILLVSVLGFFGIRGIDDIIDLTNTATEITREAQDILVKANETAIEIRRETTELKARSDVIKEELASVENTLKRLAAVEGEIGTLKTKVSAQEIVNQAFNEEDRDIQIELFSEAIRLRPDYALALLGRGVAYGAKREYARAIEDFDEAIRLKPDDAYGYYNRGIAYKRRGRNGDNDRAIQDYDEAIRLKPDVAGAHLGRGLVYYNKGEYARAIQDYDEAIRLKPDDASAYYNRGIAYERKGDYDHAIQDYDEAIRLKPDDASMYNNRCWVHALNGSPDRALEDCNTALNLRPESAAVLDSRALAYWLLGNAAAAKADLQQARSIDPERKTWQERFQEFKELSRRNPKN